MIEDWRSAWAQGPFPFLFVQLANYGRVRDPHHWPELREAQEMIRNHDEGAAGTVTVVEYDDGNRVLRVKGAGEVNPALTSVRVFTHKLGALAAETLLRRLAEPERPAATNLIQPELIVRDSSTPSRRAAG